MVVIFWRMLGVSLSMTPVILLLLVLAQRFCRRYSAGLRCSVWALMTARLLLPFHLSLAGILRGIAPVDNLLNKIDPVAVADALRGMLAINAGTANTAEQTALDGAFWGRLCGVVWVAGMLLFLCGNLMVHRATSKRLQQWSTPVTDPFLLKIFYTTKKRVAVRKQIGFFQTERVHTPMLVGIRRPKIYIPQKRFSACELSDILAHELCHYKRKDLWWKLAFLLAQSVHWFNPVVYCMLRQAELDFEQACDSDVLRGACYAARKQYGRTMLSFLEATTVPMPVTTNFYGGKKQMKARFANMLDQKQKKSGVLFTVFVAAIIVLCGTLAQNNAFASLPNAEAEISVEDMDNSPLPESHGNGEMAWPVPGFYKISKSFGMSIDGNDFHTGVDITGDGIHGASIIAPADGVVTFVQRKETPNVGFGMYVVIDHGLINGYQVYTQFSHLGEILVKTGDTVEKGQVISKVGSTGYTSVLQFDVKEKDPNEKEANIQAVDPAPYLNQKKN